MAGVFVLVAIALTVLCVVVLTNFADALRPKSRYIVRFGMLDGADGLDAGSPVKVGGQRVGQVEKWAFALDEATGEPRAIDVTIAINRGLRLYSDADVTLVKPLLGGQSTLNIAPNPGNFAITEAVGPAGLLAPNNLSGPSLRGRLGGPGFLAPSDYARLRGVLDNFEIITGQFKENTPQLIDDARRTLTNINDATSDARAMIADARPLMSDIRQKWPIWSENVSGSLAGIEREIKAAEGLTRRIGEGVDEVRQFVSDARGALQENRPKIAEVVENVRSVIDTFRNKDYETLTSALDDAKKTMAEARDAAERVNRMIVTKSPELEELVTSANLSAQQLKLAVGEIRSSPWRLLYQPSKKELENELLYNAVRQYANSVSELKAAASALESAGERAGQGGTAIDQRIVGDLTAKLQDAFDRYQQQERAFLNRWVEDDGKSSR